MNQFNFIMNFTIKAYDLEFFPALQKGPKDHTHIDNVEQSKISHNLR